MENGLSIMIGGDMNTHIILWEMDGGENENGKRMKGSMMEENK